MGQLVDGVWKTGWYDPDAGGAFQRPATKFRDQVTSDGSSGFAAEAGRYHLYASYACPWAHRILIVRALRGLEAAIDVTIVEAKMGDLGWSFAKEEPDPLVGARHLSDVYLAAAPRYSGRVTVPVLFDKVKKTIVNNESREIMRMLDTPFDALASGPSLAPARLRPRIDETLTAIYEPFNNGVYRAGFAGQQAAYEAACRDVFAALARWDAVLAEQPFLCGDTLTEADIAFFTTALRFDLVYYAHFKCNIRRLADHPHVSRLVAHLYSHPAIRATCRLDHIKTHYYWSQTTVNPSRIVPLGPEPNFG
jgi:glutathionyl-hydroquinone reductase